MDDKRSLAAFPDQHGDDNIPKTVLGFLNHGLLRLNQQKPDEAINAISQANQLQAETAEAYYLSGLVAFYLDHYVNAIQSFEKSQRKNPNMRESAYMLGVIHFLLGNNADGLFYAKLSETLQPHPTISGIIPDWVVDLNTLHLHVDDQFLLKKALQKLRSGQLESAIQLLDQIYTLKPDDLEVTRYYAYALMDIRRFLLAETLLKQACALSNNHPNDLESYCQCLMELGDYDTLSDIGIKEITNERPIHPPKIHQMFAMLIQAAWRNPNSSKSLCYQFIDSWKDILHPRDKAIHKTKPQSKPIISKSKKKTRIGVLSTRVRHAAGLDTIWPFIADLASLYDIIIYCLHDSNDFIAKNLQAQCDWVDCENIDEQTLMHIINTDQIDILIDMDTLDSKGSPHIALQANVPVILAMLADQDLTGHLGYDGIISMGNHHNKTSISNNIILQETGCFYLEQNNSTSSTIAKSASHRILILSSFGEISDEQINWWHKLLTMHDDIELVFLGHLIGRLEGWNHFIHSLPDTFAKHRVRVVDQNIFAYYDLKEAIAQKIDLAILDPWQSHLDEVAILLQNAIPVVGLLKHPNLKQSALSDRLLMQQLTLCEYLPDHYLELEHIVGKLIKNNSARLRACKQIQSRYQQESSPTASKQRVVALAQHLYQLAS